MSNKKRRSLRPIKDELYRTHGKYCWNCMQKFKKDILQGHHIELWSICKKNEIWNIAILCPTCHTEVHAIEYNSKEYWQEMNKIRKNGEKLRYEKLGSKEL